MADRICVGVVYRMAFLLAGGVFAAAAVAAPGDLDTTFNSQGSIPGAAITDFGSASDRANAVLMQPDGKIVAAGATIGGAAYDVFALARYNADGTLDQDFNVAGSTPGTLITDFGGDGQANAVVVQADGKLVAAGSAVGQVNGASRKEFALARYNADGTLDKCFDMQTLNCSFNSDGGTTLTPFTGDAQVSAVALQADGKLVAAGSAVVQVNGAGQNVIALARYNTDGTLDTCFNNAAADCATSSSGGTETIVVGDDAQATAVVIQRDGKIVVAGYRTLNGNVDFMVLRCKPDGTLDDTFNPGGAQPGVVTTDLGGDDRAYSLLTQFDDKIVLGGSTTANAVNSQFALVRYGSDGALDTTFNNTGIVTTSFGVNAAARIQGLGLQPDGALLAAGVATPGAANEVGLARYTAAGAADTSFGSGGIVVSSVTTGNDMGYALALDPNGKFLVAGATDNGQSTNDFLVARYQAAAAAWQLHPDPFALDNMSDVKPGTFQTASVAPLQGLGTGLTVPVRVSGGTIAKGTQNTYLSGGWAQNQDQFTVGLTADAKGGRSTSATLSIGGLAAPNNMMVAVGPVVSATFTVTTDQGPRITGTPSTTTEATTYYSFIPRANDQDSNDQNPTDPSSGLTFSIVNKPSWARFDMSSGKLDGFPGGGDLGTTKGIVISVTDPQGMTASLPPFDLTVTNSSDGGGLGPLSLAAMLLAGWLRRRAIRP